MTFEEFFTQDVTVDAWLWLMTCGCTVYCLLEVASYLAHRKWRNRGPLTEDEENKF